MLVSTTVGITLWRAWRRTSAQLATTQRSLAAEQAERAQWRQRAEGALTGMAHAINEQFDRAEPQVPRPRTYAVMSVGFAGVGLFGRRRMHRGA